MLYTMNQSEESSGDGDGGVDHVMDLCTAGSFHPFRLGSTLSFHGASHTLYQRPVSPGIGCLYSENMLAVFPTFRSAGV